MKIQQIKSIFLIIIGIITGIFISGILLLFLLPNSRSDKLLLVTSTSSYPVTNLDTTICPSTSEPSVGDTKINLNTASVTELDSLPGIGLSKASSIVEFRTKYGDFKSIEELVYVPGISDNIFLKICNLVTATP